MIKLVASRLEGLLMNDQGQIDRSALQTRLSEMQKHGTQLVLISRESYPYLLAKFQHVSGPLNYVAENGAETVVNGVNVHEKMLGAVILSEILQWLSEKSDFARTTVTLSSRLNTITNAVPGSHLASHLKQLYPTVTWAPDLMMVASQIYQIRIDVPTKGTRMYEDLVHRKFGTQVKIVAGGPSYFYVTAPEVNLGKSLAVVQEQLKVRNRQTAAFGRTMADFNYLNAAKYGYTVTDASSTVQAIATPLSGTDYSEAVFKQIDRLMKKP